MKINIGNAINSLSPMLVHVTIIYKINQFCSRAQKHIKN